MKISRLLIPLSVLCGLVNLYCMGLLVPFGIALLSGGSGFLTLILGTLSIETAKKEHINSAMAVGFAIFSILLNAWFLSLLLPMALPVAVLNMDIARRIVHSQSSLPFSLPPTKIGCFFLGTTILALAALSLIGYSAIICTWVLPLIALRWSLAKTIGWIILPAQWIKQEGQAHIKDNPTKVELPSVEAYRFKGNNPNNKVIIYFGGNGETITQNPLKDNAAAAIYCLNFAGVGCSAGNTTSKEDLTCGGIALAEKLLREGIKAKNLVFYGESLGGMASTFCAEYFHKKNQPVFLFNSRSLSTLGHYVVSGLCSSQKPSRIKSLIVLLLNVLLWLLGWGGMNAAKAYKGIPHKYKDYICIQHGDEVLRSFASLHHSVKSTVNNKIKRKEINNSHKYEGFHHTELSQLYSINKGLGSQETATTRLARYC
jgi:hypothetical protein